MTEERIRELEKAERKLRALENAGVDNWDGYDDAMDEIQKAEDYDNYIYEVASKIIDILGENIEEPAGQGCGYGITEKGGDALVTYLRILNIPREEEGK